MKKTLTAAITSALVVGAVSTSFAAANPFRDVPVSHWSFEAVVKLAREGVIEGYGDNTFRGNAHITRYEMAQMVAKAMAKEEQVDAATKATIDKLAAEYGEELNHLGVRVSELEKKSDNVRIEGNVKIEAGREKYDGVKSGTESIAKLELDIAAQVNDKWMVNGVIEAESDLKTNSSGQAEATQIYAEGPLFGANAKLGKFGTFDAENLTAGGMLIDTEVSGAEFSFGDKLATTLTVARIGGDDYFLTEGAGASDYQAIQFVYPVNDKLSIDAGYYRLHNNTMFNDGDSASDTNRIWTAGLDYQIAPDFVLGGLYAGSDLKAEPGLSSGMEKAYSVQLTYKGADTEVPNSYGIWAAYRHLGSLAVIAPTYDGVAEDQKGLEIGVDYMLAKNILGKIVYFDGKEISSDADTTKIFGQLEFTF